jgi:hypothetical protein
MIVVHVTGVQHAMSIHVKADIQSERQSSKEIRSAMRFRSRFQTRPTEEEI